MDNSDIAITLVLISAFMHATWNAVVRAGSSRFMTLAIVDGTALVICLAALPLVNVPSLQVWGYVLLSVILNTVYRLFLIKAYETGDFGQVYPVMRGVPPVLVALFSYFLLHEQLSFQAMAGVLLICLGIISLTFVRRMTAHMLKPILMAVGAGVFIASYTVVDAKGVRASETVLQYIIYLTVFQNIPIPLLAFCKERAALVQTIGSHWRVGVLGGGGVTWHPTAWCCSRCRWTRWPRSQRCGKPVLLSAPLLPRCSFMNGSAGDGCSRRASLFAGSS
ncbi:EamA-like transporter family protein [Pseudomonas sp. DD1]